MKQISYLDTPCPRCGSKRFVAKVWKVKTPTYSGAFTEIEHSQIECTNRECQATFSKQLIEETKKREELRAKREQSDKERKERSLARALTTRSKKSRI